MEIKELKNAMPGTKSSLNKQSKVEATEDIISELEGRWVKIIQSEKREE